MSGRIVHCDHSGCKRAARVRLYSRCESLRLLLLLLSMLPGPPPAAAAVVYLADRALVAGIDRQQLIASARQAAGGLLAGLAAATVSLTASPAGAEVRMPPIDRNGEHHAA